MTVSIFCGLVGNANIRGQLSNHYVGLVMAKPVKGVTSGKEGGKGRRGLRGMR